MSKYPLGWLIATIRDVTVPKVEQGLVADSHGEFVYVDISSIDNATKRVASPKKLAVKNAPSRARQRLKEGDVVVSMTRPNLNAVAKITPDLDGAVGSTGFDVLRAVLVEPNWLFHTVQSPAFIGTMSGLVQGALYPAVRPEDVRSYSLNIPPLNEQRRIIAKLDSLFERSRNIRGKLGRISPLLDKLRKSILVAATSGALTADWRAKHGLDLDTWKETSLGEVITKVEAGLNVKCEERPPLVNEKGLVKISAVTWGRYDDEESKTLPPGAQAPERNRIRIGDFLISRANTIELVGACVIVEAVQRPVFLSDKVLRLVMPHSHKKWILYWLRSPKGRQQIEGLASGNQLSMRNLSQAKLKSIPIKLPTEEEQQEIIQRVDALMDRATRLQAAMISTRSEIPRLEKSALAKAFRGELVPQDPNDEPASALLERILAEREVGGTTRRARPGGKRQQNPQQN